MVAGKARTLERLNSALSKVTGYRIARVSPTFADREMASTIAAVRAYTMTSDEKLHGLITATRYIVKHGVPGDFVECGVWRGGSMQAVARTLCQLGVDDRDLYLFDTFEGMTTPSDRDVRFDGQTAETRMAAFRREGSQIWAYASLDDVRSGFAEVPYPRERVHFIKGPVEQTIPDSAPDSIALLRLDTDWYESTAHEFRHLYHRLASGGVLILDDYEWWQGAKQATDEFLAEAEAKLLLVRMGDGRIAVKP